MQSGNETNDSLKSGPAKAGPLIFFFWAQFSRELARYMNIHIGPSSYYKYSYASHGQYEYSYRELGPNTNIHITWLTYVRTGPKKKNRFPGLSHGKSESKSHCEGYEML